MGTGAEGLGSLLLGLGGRNNLQVEKKSWQLVAARLRRGGPTALSFTGKPCQLSNSDVSKRSWNAN